MIFDNIAGQTHVLYGFKHGHPSGHSGWEFPGGKHDPGETLRECAIREVWEETGLIVNPYFLTNVESGGYVCVFYGAVPVEGELELREPHKHREWKWFPVDQPPQGLIYYCRDGIYELGRMNELNICFNRHRDDRSKRKELPDCGNWGSNRGLVDSEDTSANFPLLHKARHFYRPAVCPVDAPSNLPKDRN